MNVEAAKSVNHRRRRGRAWLIAALAVMIGAIIYRLERSHSFIAEVTLPYSAYRLHLLQVTDGPLNYEWKDPNEILRTIPLPFPVNLGSRRQSIKLGLHGESTTEQLPGAASFLFRLVDQKGRFVNPPGFNDLQINFRDSTGFVFTDASMGRRGDVWGSFPFTVPAIPRRDQKLNILVTQSEMKQTVEMVIDNPFHRTSFEEWSAEPLPATRSSESQSVTLKGLIVKRSDGIHPMVQPQLGIQDVAGELRSAIPAYHWFEDATGNNGQFLSPFEKVWKLHALIHRSNTAELPKDWVFNLGTFDLSSQESIRGINFPERLHGATLMSLCLISAGTFERPDNQWLVKQSGELQPRTSTNGFSMIRRHPVTGKNSIELTSVKPGVIVAHTKLPKDVQLVLRARAGEEVIVSKQAASIEIWDGSHTLMTFDTPPGTQQVELELVVSKAEHFEFLVEPPQDLRDYWTNAAKQAEP